MRDALACCAAVAGETGGRVESVLPFSTGVIGEPLPVEKISADIPAAVTALDENGWHDAAQGIMTTDTRPKGFNGHLEYQGKTITVNGIAKDDGMNRPHLSTLQEYID